MQSIHPPKEELEFQLQRETPVRKTAKARPADIVSRWLNDNVFDENAEALRVTLDTRISDPVYFENEDALETSRSGMLIGAVKDDETFHALKMTDADRLMVDANLSLQEVDLEVHLDASNDSVAIGDRTTGTLLKVEDDGSINTNIAVSGINDDDSILIVGTSDGTINGARNLAKINNAKLHVLDEESKAVATDIRNKIGPKMVSEIFDEVELSYISAGNGKDQLGQAVYKNNSSTVATVQLDYDSDNRLIRARRI